MQLPVNLLLSIFKKCRDVTRGQAALVRFAIGLVGCPWAAKVCRCSSEISYDPTTKIITYKITWTLGNSAATTTNMHFHGSDTGSDLVSSGVAIGITGFATGSSGTLSGITVALTDVQAAQLLAGKWYVNIHSSTVGSGELRGNIKF